MEKSIELYPIYGFWHVPFWQTTLFVYTLIAGAVLVGVGILWLLVRWYQKRRSNKKPWEIALARLRELNSMLAHEQQMSSKELYIHITIIIKHYLYARYGFNVESKTDEELLLFLEHTSLDPELITLLRQVVEDGVYAKFAKSEHMRDVLMRDLHHCEIIIQKTIPQAP